MDVRIEDVADNRLRDEFAMAALTGFCGQTDSTGMWSWTPPTAVEMACEAADAMMAVRQAQSQERRAGE